MEIDDIVEVKIIQKRKLDIDEKKEKIVKLTDTPIAEFKNALRDNDYKKCSEILKLTSDHELKINLNSYLKLVIDNYIKPFNIGYDWCIKFLNIIYNTLETKNLLHSRDADKTSLEYDKYISYIFYDFVVYIFHENKHLPLLKANIFEKHPLELFLISCQVKNNSMMHKYLLYVRNINYALFMKICKILLYNESEYFTYFLQKFEYLFSWDHSSSTMVNLYTFCLKIQNAKTIQFKNNIDKYVNTEQVFLRYISYDIYCKNLDIAIIKNLFETLLLSNVNTKIKNHKTLLINDVKNNICVNINNILNTITESDIIYPENSDWLSQSQCQVRSSNKLLHKLQSVLNPIIPQTLNHLWNIVNLSVSTLVGLALGECLLYPLQNIKNIIDYLISKWCEGIYLHLINLEMFGAHGRSSNHIILEGDTYKYIILTYHDIINVKSIRFLDYDDIVYLYKNGFPEQKLLDITPKIYYVNQILNRCKDKADIVIDMKMDFSVKENILEFKEVITTNFNFQSFYGSMLSGKLPDINIFRSVINYIEGGRILDPLAWKGMLNKILGLLTIFQLNIAKPYIDYIVSKSTVNDLSYTSNINGFIITSLIDKIIKDTYLYTIIKIKDTITTIYPLSLTIKDYLFLLKHGVLESKFDDIPLKSLTTQQVLYICKNKEGEFDEINDIFLKQ